MILPSAVKERKFDPLLDSLALTGEFPEYTPVGPLWQQKVRVKFFSHKDQLFGLRLRVDPELRQHPYHRDFVTRYYRLLFEQCLPASEDGSITTFLEQQPAQLLCGPLRIRRCDDGVVVETEAARTCSNCSSPRLGRLSRCQDCAALR